MSGPGLSEAIKVVTSPKYNTDPATRMVDEATVRVIYPIIAAAVRADERAKVLTVIRSCVSDAMSAVSGPLVIRESARAALRGVVEALDKIAALNEPSTP